MATITLLPSPHAEGAKALIDKIRALRTEIPRFTGPAVSGRRLAFLAGVPDTVLESASMAVQNFPRLEQAAGVDATTLRDAYAFALAYESVAQELRALTRDMEHSIRVQRAEAAASALDVLAIARSISRRKDGAELRPHVDDMRKKLGRIRRTRRPSSEPAPAPAAATTAPSKPV